MQDGLQHLHKATELDSSLIAARIDLVNLCVTQAFYGFMAPVVAADHVRRTAAAIPDLVDRAEGILPALGWVHFHVDHDLAKAIQAFSASSHLTHDAWTTRLRVMFALSRRRYEEGIGLLREALDEDPFSPWLHSRLAWALHLDGQADASLEQCHAIVEQFPNHEGTCLYGAAILAFHGDTALATELARDLAQRSPYFDLATATHAYALACSGQKDEARAIAERLQWLSRERFVISSFMPAVYVALEDEKAALLELRASRDSRCPWFFQMLADPRLKPLHGLPEFEQMCAILPRMEADAERSLGLEL
jgi:tetratricopeptide (TPR) repeat protein